MTRVLMVAGEVSGDIHAGNLLVQLRQLVPDVEAFGVGGDRLAAAGLECLARTEELSHMGLVEVVRELSRLRRILNSLVQAAAARRPSVAVLVLVVAANVAVNSRVTARPAVLVFVVAEIVAVNVLVWPAAVSKEP